MHPVSSRALILGLGTCLVLSAALARAQVPGAALDARTLPLDDLRHFATRYQYEDVTTIDPWQDVSVEYAQRFGFGTMVAGVNAAQRYRQNGVQFELQAYPRLSRRSYLFIDGAWSNSKEVYLPLRLAAEPYYNFSNGWETSAGARYLQTPGTDVVTYTGTLAKYFGNYWLSGRPSYSPATTGNSYGWEVTGRRYFSDRYDYLTLLVGRSIGIDAEAKDPLRFTRQAKLGDLLARLERRQPIGRTRSRITYGIGYEREEIAPGRNRLHRSATLGLEWFTP
ncbi:MAG: YaiO family outer membrane beta-barrel protein [Gemmatimonadaceae bacterium]